MTAYCDFCECDSCVSGPVDGTVSAITATGEAVRVKTTMSHAPTSDGKWICDTCWRYECCVDAGHDPDGGECGERKCSHRPTLSGEWS